jgi:hypothetical protein
MSINDANQEVVGGVPQTNLTIPDIITYFGAIVGSNSDGDLCSWQQDANAVEVFTYKSDGLYDHTDTIEEDLEGRDLDFVVELAEELFQ